MMKYLLLAAVFMVGCSTTSPPTMKDAIDIQMQRDFEREQQKRMQDIINDNIIQSSIS